MKSHLRFIATVAGCAAALSSSQARADDVPRAPDQHFQIDPVADIILTAGGAGVSALTGLILSTGEIVPTKPGPESNLLSIDRVALTNLDPHAATYSDIGLWFAIGFAAADPFLSGMQFGWDATLVDLTMFSESLALTLAITDVTKVAVRRPRPIDYIHCEGDQSSTSSCQGTDLQLSFFSGHASTVAAVSATATYLSFVRSPNTPLPWITLAAGTALTSFVSYERVRSGAHFPTDVIAGALAGGAIGVLVPHLHRYPHPGVWVGFSPVQGGGVANLQGRF